MTEVSRRRRLENEPLGPPINLGLIGYGVSGKNQRKAIDALPFSIDPGLRAGRRLRLATICDKVPKTENGVTFTTDYRKLLEDDTIHAVSIATPPGSHYQIAKEALTAGKHVYIEKPPALTTDECDELIDLAKENGKTLFFSYHYRYHPLIDTAKKLLEGKKISSINVTISQDAGENHDPSMWIFNPAVAGGGTLIDDGINFLAVATQILPQATQISVTNATFDFTPGIGVETKADVGFRFGEEGEGRINLDWMNKTEQERKIEFVANGITYTADLRRNTLNIDGKPFAVFGQLRGDWDKVREYQGAYADFARCIIENESFTPTKELKFVQEAYRAGGVQYTGL